MIDPPIKKRYLFSPNLWIGLGLLAGGGQLVAGTQPELVEMVYSQGIFLVNRRILDAIAGWTPFPLWPVLSALVISLLITRAFRMLIGPDTFLRKAICLLRGIAGFTGALIFFFLVLWGYNYQRIDLEVRLGIQPIPLSVEQTFEELEQVTTELLDARFLMSRDTLPLEAVPQTMHLPSIRQSTLEHLRALLIGFGIPAPEGLVARQLRPPGILLQISTAGFYFPLTGECNIDDGLHPLQVPFVLAHEYAHGYGIGDEGSCNFLAYLALKTADDPWLRYSGALGYWRYVASSARRLDPERYSTFYSHLNKGVRQDLISIRRQMEKFPDLFPVARDRVYSAYLQTQGITEGLANYSRVVRLARAWRHIAIDVPSCDVGKE